MCRLTINKIIPNHGESAAKTTSTTEKQSANNAETKRDMKTSIIQDTLNKYYFFNCNTCVPSSLLCCLLGVDFIWCGKLPYTYEIKYFL